METTSDRSDDLALAAEMIEAARATLSDPDLLPLLCNRAYELAIESPQGYKSALTAMCLLADNVSDRRWQALAQILSVRQ